MNERERVHRFNQSLDRILAGTPHQDDENLSDNDRKALSLVRTLRDLDLSAETKQKYALYRQLLAKHTQTGSRNKKRWFSLPALWENAQPALRWGLSASALFALVVVLNWALKSLVSQPASPTRLPATQAITTAAPVVSQPPLLENLGKLAYISEGSLWVKPLPDGAPIRLAEGGSEPRWSPSGRWLAFRRGNEQAWIINTQSRQQISLNDGQPVGPFAWKPQQDILAYVAGENEIRLYNPEMGEETLLVPHIENRKTLQLAWRPDGEYLALHWFESTTENPPYSAIWVVSKQGELQPGEIYNGDPELLGWIGDGGALLLWDGMLVGDGGAAFSASLRSDGLPLVRVPLKDHNPQIVADRVLLYKDFVKPDPAGTDRLAVIIGGGRESWTGKVLYLIDGDQLEQLSPLGEAASSPAWSPDGRMLAYVSAADPGRELLTGGEPVRQALMVRRLYVMDLDARQPRALTDDPAYRDEYPWWSKDGNWLLFPRLDEANRASLWLIPAEGGEPQVVIDELDTGVDWLGYYGHIEWDRYFDWWQKPAQQAAVIAGTPTSTSAPTLISPLEEQRSTRLPRLRLSKGRIQRIALSPQGDRIAVGSSMGVCLYDSRSWEERWCDQVDPLAMGGVLSLEFDPEGTRIAAGTWSGLVAVWDAYSGERLWKVDTNFDNVRCLAWAPDGERLIAGGDDGWFVILAGATGEALRSLRAGWPSVLAAEWSPDGHSFATGDFFGEVVIWEASHYQRIGKFNLPGGWNVTGLVWTPDSKVIVVGYANEPGCGEGCNPDFTGQIAFLDASSGELIRSRDTGSPVKRLVLNPAGDILAAGLWDALASQEPSDAEVWLIDPQSGELLKKLPGGRSDLGLDWFPQGDRLLIPGENGRLSILALTADRQEIALSGYDEINAFTWSPDGSRLATATLDGRVLLWDASSGARISKFDTGDGGFILSWSPDGSQLATAQEGITIWDIQHGSSIAHLSLPDSAPPHDLKWSPDGSHLAATFGEGQLTIWETSSWRAMLSIQSAILSGPIAWSPDSSQISLGGGGENHQQVAILETAGGQVLTHLEASGWIESLSWSRSGDRLAAAGGGWAEVWDVSSGLRLFQSSGEGVHSWGIEQVALNPDGNVLATAAGEVVLWDINTGKQVALLVGLNDGVTALAFSPDGSSLAARSDDGVVLVWDIEP